MTRGQLWLLFEAMDSLASDDESFEGMARFLAKAIDRRCMGSPAVALWLTHR